MKIKELNCNNSELIVYCIVLRNALHDDVTFQPVEIQLVLNFIDLPRGCLLLALALACALPRTRVRAHSPSQIADRCCVEAFEFSLCFCKHFPLYAEICTQAQQTHCICMAPLFQECALLQSHVRVKRCADIHMQIRLRFDATFVFCLVTRKSTRNQTRVT